MFLKRLFYKIKKKILTIFGDICYSKYPFWIYYRPPGYKINGKQIREVLEIIKPGDIILRKYNNFLDGKFIPGEYTHSGIYVGNNCVIHMLAEGCVCEDIIDFLTTDKICVLRPLGGVKRAIQRAWKVYNNKTEYDFNFDDKSLERNLRFYCHEFVAYCYKEYNIEKVSGKIFKYITIPKKILADSFLTNKRFKFIIKF